jgi:hypothetical protein
MVKGIVCGAVTGLALALGVAGSCAAADGMAPASAGQAAMADVVATGVRVTGDVTVMAGGYPMPFVGGVPLRGGDTVITPPGRSQAIMRLDGAMELILGADSRLTLAPRTQGTSGWVGGATLEAGTLRLYFPRGPLWETFTIATPSAEAGTGDGDILVGVVDGMTTVYVQDGRATVNGLGRADVAQAVLPAGAGVDVLAGQDPYDPQPWPEGRIKEVRDRIGPR